MFSLSELLMYRNDRLNLIRHSFLNLFLWSLCILQLLFLSLVWKHFICFDEVLPGQEFGFLFSINQYIYQVDGPQLCRYARRGWMEV